MREWNMLLADNGAYMLAVTHALVKLPPTLTMTLTLTMLW